MLSTGLTPRQAAGVLGVSESTVRRWCDAGLIETRKTNGGHRRIERHVLLAFAREKGLITDSVGSVVTAGRGGRLPAKNELTRRFYEELVDGDEQRAQQFLVELLERTGDAAAICDDVVAPALHRIGDDWSHGKLAVYREHAATERALTAISAVRNQVPLASPDAPLALCAALTGDPYSLAPSMCSLVLRAAGYRTALLGPGTPIGQIALAASDLSASLIALSVSTDSIDEDALVDLCERAAEQGIRVALGGRVLSPELRRKLRPDFFGDTMSHLLGYASRLINSL